MTQLAVALIALAVLAGYIVFCVKGWPRGAAEFQGATRGIPALGLQRRRRVPRRMRRRPVRPCRDARGPFRLHLVDQGDVERGMRPQPLTLIAAIYARKRATRDHRENANEG
jgi:hypothetical protein